MKRITTISAICLFAIAAVSCQKENDRVQSAKYESFSLNAVSEQNGRTHLDGTSVIWDNGDALSAFSANADTHTNNRLDATSYGSNVASFSGQIEAGTTSFYAVYPYGDLSYTDGVISGASVPATQTATNGSFSNGVSLAMAAGTKTPGTPDCGSLTFKNLCAVLSFTLPENITFANKIVVTSKSGTGMAGAVSIDCSKQEISGAATPSVTLNGTFAGGSTYYIAVAPGTYTNGFSFTISTSGGNSYTRETTKTVPAAAGKIYPLGSLSLALAQDAFTTSVSISHDVVSSALKGSTAKFNLSVKDEFAPLVKSCSAVVTLKNGSATVCRSKTISGVSVSNAALDMQNGFYYLPKGDYSYTAEVTYTVNNGTKDVQRVVVCSGNASSPQPSGLALDANLSGYTSYSCYKGTDGQSANVATANGKDNATIYGIGATYKSGLTPDVYNQCSGLLSISSTLDGQTASGDKGGQSWAAHTIGATWSFDGASGTCHGTKTVYVTGLPYNPSNSSTTEFKGDWSFSGGSSAWDDKESRYKLRNGATATFKGFYMPGDVNGTVDYRIEAYVSTRFVDITTIFNVGSTSVINETISGTAKTVEYKTTKQVAFTSTKNTMTCQSKGSSSSWATSQVWVYRVGVTYR